jgi:hypothetical protein
VLRIDVKADTFHVPSRFSVKPIVIGSQVEAFGNPEVESDLTDAEWRVLEPVMPGSEAAGSAAAG